MRLGACGGPGAYGCELGPLSLRNVTRDLGIKVRWKGGVRARYGEGVKARLAKLEERVAFLELRLEEERTARG